MEILGTTCLALDTATEACSVALFYRGKIYTRYEVIPRLHAKRLLPMVSEVLEEAGIHIESVDVLAFGRGPGAFTGIRVVTGVVQGLAFALDIPVVAISDLAILAQRAWREYGATEVAVAIDARMGEVYWGCYRLSNQEMCLIGEECVIAPSKVCLPDSAVNWQGVGTGFSYIAQMPISCSVVDDALLPHAEDLLALAIPVYDRGEAVAVDKISPIYLRDNVATPKIIL